MIASLLARPAMLAYLAGLLAIGGYALYQSHQIATAEANLKAAESDRDKWQAKHTTLEVELAQATTLVNACRTAVESIRQEAANRARAAKEARERAEALARERDAAVTRWRASAGASCVEAMPMVREALGL
jgi:chromosome segregation ATPase